VRDLFCAEEGPRRMTSLAALQDALHVPYYAEYVGAAEFMGLSTSLSGRFVSPINPRVIMRGWSASSPQTGTFIAFQRGVQRLEIATEDRRRDALNFYLISFTQACNAAPGGCLPGDLYTPAIEDDWIHVDIQDDEDLKNTPEDCRQCHQRGRETPLLLMRELETPWMHFFKTPLDQTVGRTLASAYRLAKGGERYANFSWPVIENSSGSGLEGAVDEAQPLLFDSATIVGERFPADAPLETLPRRSPTWDRAYDAFKRGDQLALPYFAADATDADKRAALSAAYREYGAGSLPASELPDLADIFPDDGQVRAEIGLQVEPGATPAEALVQGCGPCHNDVLDQSISRARFTVALPRLDAAELEKAIERLVRAPGDAGVMPPPGARQLDSATRRRLVEYLRAGDFSPADAESLEHAAEAGMAGGSG